MQLVQVIINTTHLEQSCHFLEEFITNITNVPPDTANATKLYGTSTFKVSFVTPLRTPAGWIMFCFMRCSIYYNVSVVFLY